MKENQQIARAADTEMLKAALKESIEELRKQCFDTFANSEIHDNEGHRACRMYLRVLDDVESRFRAVIAGGESAKRKLVSVN